MSDDLYGLTDLNVSTDLTSTDQTDLYGLSTAVEQPQQLQQSTGIARSPFMDALLVPVVGATNLVGTLAAARLAYGGHAGGENLDEKHFGDTEDYVGQFANWLVVNKEKLEKKYPYVYGPAKDESYLRGQVREGAEMIVPSLGSGLPGAIAGAAVGSAVGMPVAGAIIGFAGGGGTIFGLAQYDQVVRDVLKHNAENPENPIPADVYKNEAFKQALIEGGFEAASNVIEGVTFGLGKLATQPVKESIRSILKQGWKGGAKNYLVAQAKAQPAEVATEMTQNYLQTQSNIDMGLPQSQTPWQAAVDSIIPTITSVAITGGLFHGVDVKKRANIIKALENPETDFDTRFDAMRTIYTELQKTDKVNNTNVAQKWGEIAQYKLLEGEPIELDKKFTDMKPLEGVLADQEVAKQNDIDTNKFMERGQPKVDQPEVIPEGEQKPADDKVVRQTMGLELRQQLFDKFIEKGFSEEKANDMASFIMGAKDPGAQTPNIQPSVILDKSGNPIEKEAPQDSTSDTIKLTPGKSIIQNIPENLKNQLVFTSKGELFSNKGSVKAILKKQGLSETHAPMELAQNEWVGAPIAMTQMSQNLGQVVAGNRRQPLIITGQGKQEQRPTQTPVQQAVPVAPTYENSNTDDLTNKGKPFTNKVSAMRAIQKNYKEMKHEGTEEKYVPVQLGEKQWVARRKELVPAQPKVESAQEYVNRRNTEYLAAKTPTEGLSVLDSIISDLEEQGHEKTKIYQRTVSRRSAVAKTIEREKRKEQKIKEQNETKPVTETPVKKTTETTQAKPEETKTKSKAQEVATRLNIAKKKFIDYILSDKGIFYHATNVPVTDILKNGILKNDKGEVFFTPFDAMGYGAHIVKFIAKLLDMNKVLPDPFTLESTLKGEEGYISPAEIKSNPELELKLFDLANSQKLTECIYLGNVPVNSIISFSGNEDFDEDNPPLKKKEYSELNKELVKAKDNVIKFVPKSTTIIDEITKQLDSSDLGEYPMDVLEDWLHDTKGITQEEIEKLYTTGEENIKKQYDIWMEEFNRQPVAVYFDTIADHLEEHEGDFDTLITQAKESLTKSQIDKLQLKLVKGGEANRPTLTEEEREVVNDPEVIAAKNKFQKNIKSKPFLYHATNLETVKDIEENGFNPSLGVNGGTFFFTDLNEATLMEDTTSNIIKVDTSKLDIEKLFPDMNYDVEVTNDGRDFSKTPYDLLKTKSTALRMFKSGEQGELSVVYMGVIPKEAIVKEGGETNGQVQTETQVTPKQKVEKLRANVVEKRLKAGEDVTDEGVAKFKTLALRWTRNPETNKWEEHEPAYKTEQNKASLTEEEREARADQRAIAKAGTKPKKVVKKTIRDLIKKSQSELKKLKAELAKATTEQEREDIEFAIDSTRQDIKILANRLMAKKSSPKVQWFGEKDNGEETNKQEHPLAKHISYMSPVMAQEQLDHYTEIEPDTGMRMLKKMSPVTMPRAFAAMINYAGHFSDGTVDLSMISKFITQLEKGVKAGKLDNFFAPTERTEAGTYDEKQSFTQDVAVVKDFLSKTIEIGVGRTKKSGGFKRTEGKGPGLSVKEVTDVSDRISELWPNSPFVIVLDNRDQLPPELKEKIAADSDRYDIGGAQLGDTVFLIRSELHNKFGVMRTMLHESIGHYGIYKTLGTKFDSTALSIYDSFKDTKKMEKIIFDYKFDVGKEKDRIDAGAEYLAFMAEENQGTTTFWEKVRMSINNILRSIGFGVNLTTGDLKALLSDSQKFLKGEIGASTNIEDYFSNEKIPRLDKVTNAPTFYSTLLQTVTTRTDMPTKPQSLVNWLNKFVKPAELKWMGVEQYLKGKEKINKQDFINFLSANQIKVEEVMHSDKAPGTTIPMPQLSASEILLGNYILTPEQTTYLQEFSNEWEADGDNATDDMITELHNWISEQTVTVGSNTNINYFTETALDNLGDIQIELTGRLFTIAIENAGQNGLQAALNNDTFEDEFLQSIYDSCFDNVNKFSVPSFIDVLDPFGIKLTEGELDKVYAIIDDYESDREILYDDPDSYIDGTGRSGNLRHDQWVLSGGKDQRELLLIWSPTEAPKSKVTYRVEYSAEDGNWYVYDNTDRVISSWNNPSKAEHAVTVLTNDSSKRAKTLYQSSHWHEANVLGHIRFNERIDDQGRRVLFIEEIQSDWLQDAKKYGFNTKQVYHVMNGEARVGHYNTREAAQTALNSWQKLLGQQDFSIVEGGELSQQIPTAPFLENWHVVLMKRMIRYAVDNNFDSVAWTTGKQQQERYPGIIAERVDEVIIRKLPGAYGVTAKKDGTQVLQKAADTYEKLVDYVGKELAVRAIKKLPSLLFPSSMLSNEPIYDNSNTAQHTAHYTNLDIEIGGEGMESFYDEKLKNWTEKYIKQWGARLETISMHLDKPLPKAILGEGTAAWNLEEGTHIVSNYDNLTINVLNPNGSIEYSKQFNSEEDLDDWIEDNSEQILRDFNAKQPIERKELSKQPGFTVTPEMAKSVVEKGQPWFSKTEKTLTATQTNYAQKIIDAIKESFPTEQYGFPYDSGLILPDGTAVVLGGPHSRIIEVLQSKYPDIYKQLVSGFDSFTGDLLGKLFTEVGLIRTNLDDGNAYVEIPNHHKLTQEQLDSISFAFDEADSGEIIYDVTDYTTTKVVKSGVVTSIGQLKKVTNPKIVYNSPLNKFREPRGRFSIVDYALSPINNYIKLNDEDIRKLNYVPEDEDEDGEIDFSDSKLNNLIFLLRPDGTGVIEQKSNASIMALPFSTFKPSAIKEELGMFLSDKTINSIFTAIDNFKSVNKNKSFLLDIDTSKNIAKYQVEDAKYKTENELETEGAVPWNELRNGPRPELSVNENGISLNIDSDYKPSLKLVPKKEEPRGRFRIVDYQDITPDTPKQELKNLFDDQAYAMLKTMVMQLPKNQPAMHWAERYLMSPEWYKHPTMQKIVRAAIDRHDRYFELFNLLNEMEVNPETMKQRTWENSSDIIEANMKLMHRGLTTTQIVKGETSKEYKQLEKMKDQIDTGEWKKGYGDNIPTWEQHFQNEGVGQDVINLYKAHRRSYDVALDILMEPMKKLVASIEKQAEKDNTKPKYPEFVTLNEDGKPETINLKAVLARMGSLKGTYAPRLRETGEYVVKGKRFDKVVRYHKSNRFAAELLKRELERKGYKVEEIFERERLPEDVYASLRIINTQQAIKTAMQRVEGIDPELEIKFNEELLKEVADLIRVRGFRASMVTRKPGDAIRGYITDPNERFVRYINNIAAGVAKGEAAKDMFETLAGHYEGTGKDKKLIGGIDPAKEPRAYDTATKYIEEQLRNSDAADRLVGLIKSLASFKYLGFNLRSPVVNILSLATTVPTAIHQYGLDGKGSLTKIMGALSIASNDYRKVMLGQKLDDKGEQAFIDEIKQRGYDSPQYTRDALGTIQRAHGKVWAKTMATAMYLFGKSEQWIRGTTMLAAYRLIKENNPDMDSREVTRKAHDVSDKAHGIYGKSTQLAVGQGTGPAARLSQVLYTFGKFPHNYLQMLYDTGVRKGNIKAFLYGLISPVILGGATVIPMKNLLFGIVGVMFKAMGSDDDPEKGFWDWIRKKLGKTPERIGRHGLLGAANLDVSGSMSIGVGTPRNFYELFGIGGGLYKDVEDAMHFLQIGQPGRAAEKVLPTGFANVFRAIRELNGVTTTKGQRVWDDSGKPYIPSTMETAARLVGFRSAEQATMGERTWETKREIASYKVKHDKILERWRDYVIDKGSSKDMKSIMDDISNYNNAIMKSKKAGQIPFITNQTLKTQAKALYKPSKSMYMGMFNE